MSPKRAGLCSVRKAPSSWAERGIRFAGDCRWRGQSRANPSLKPNSLLAGKIQGILRNWPPGPAIGAIFGSYFKSLRDIPYALEQGIEFGLAGN